MASKAKKKIVPQEYYRRVSEFGVIFTNEGATAENEHTLPPAAVGLGFTFICVDADGLKLSTSGTDTIRIGTSQSAAGGYARTSVIGSTITLVCPIKGQWIALSKEGTWQLDF